MILLDKVSCEITSLVGTGTQKREEILMLNSTVFYFVAAGLIVAVISYLLGSISFSIIFTRILNHNTDIRSLGNGNAGMTNVMRSVGLKAGVLTLIFDFGKGALSVLIGREVFRYLSLQTGLPPYIQQYGAYIAGLCCILGHIYPLYFQFKGGKGVLASAAMLAFVDWRFFLVGIAVFAIVFAITRIVSISSICGAVSLPISNFGFVYFTEYRGTSLYGPVPLSYVWITTLFALTIAALLVVKHRQNILRLKNGTEKKFTIKHSS